MIYSKNPEGHLEHLETVLKLLREHRFYAKRSKCTFNKSEVKFLGHIIVGREGLKVDAAEFEVVKNWPTPQDATPVRQILGLTDYFRNSSQTTQQLRPHLWISPKEHGFCHGWD